MNIKKFVDSLTVNERRELLAILMNGEAERMTVREWIEKTPQLSERVKNSLKFSEIANEYMDQLQPQDFMRVRNFGITSLREVRRYFPI